MADANMTVLTRNDLDLIVDKTTGRIAWVVKAPDGTHATVERGYTGVRDITGLCAGVSGGTITVSRDGATVVWAFTDVTVSAGTTTLFNGAPNMTMFLPDSLGISGPLVEANGDPTARFGLSSTGVAALWGASTTQIHNGTLTHTVNRLWGTALPGVAVGTGVVYL